VTDREQCLAQSQQHAIVANILTRLKNAEGLAKLFHAKRAFIRECNDNFYAFGVVACWLVTRDRRRDFQDGQEIQRRAVPVHGSVSDNEDGNEGTPQAPRDPLVARFFPLISASWTCAYHSQEPRSRIFPMVCQRLRLLFVNAIIFPLRLRPALARVDQSRAPDTHHVRYWRRKGPLPGGPAEAHPPAAAQQRLVATSVNYGLMTAIAVIEHVR
jgi:hypothetical protein